MPSTDTGTVKAVNVGTHRIAPGAPTFIVAEAGVNHNGSTETALRLVDVAASAGADAVKFQMFHAAELTAVGATTAGYQRRGCGEPSQRAMLAQLELSHTEFLRIKKRCEQRSILFLATPFGILDVTDLQNLGVGAIKIASTDLTNDSLLAAAAATELPLIVSTGASSEDEIRSGVGWLWRQGARDRLILLHCISCYPTPIEALNLRAIATLQRCFGVPCGLSDHTTSTQTGSWAVAAGACLLEKHFTLDPTAKGPDHAMSLSPHQLAEYVATVRTAEAALGNGQLGMTDLEAEVARVARRSVVAASDIPAGTRFTAEMLTLKRPGTGIGSGEIDELIGRRASVDIAQDTTLKWDMVR